MIESPGDILRRHGLWARKRWGQNFLHDPAAISRCRQQVTIPMHLGTDSLNVAVASGVLLYHYTRLAKEDCV